MANIKQITVVLVTADLPGAGAAGIVYLGIAGREFALATAQDDYEPGSQTYVLGEGGNVENAARNDPRNPQLDTDDLDRYPVYIRAATQTEGTSTADWCLQQVHVTVNSGAPAAQEFTNPRLNSASGIWLSEESGQQLHLKRHDRA
ncbi:MULTISPECIES: hypothetical protein [unclassified Streptomyces]|uniref:hypothetical protein n=1 Tax=unclassified Streptomyces TaxID=2593676 RepID=UPI0033E9EB02